MKNLNIYIVLMNGLLDLTFRKEVICMNRLDLYHFSFNENWKLDRSFTYHQIKHQKPNGLWLSDETDKRSWSWFLNGCPSDPLEVNTNLYPKYKITVDLTNILTIKNMKELAAFTKEYKTNDLENKPRYIDWCIISEKYSGILITPFIRQYRFVKNHNWYHTWDVASACIWDLFSIVNVEKC